MCRAITGAILLGGYLRDVLYGVAPTDARTFAVVSVLLLAVSAVASVIPAPPVYIGIVQCGLPGPRSGKPGVRDHRRK
jgi:hypothetical protein